MKETVYFSLFGPFFVLLDFALVIRHYYLSLLKHALLTQQRQNLFLLQARKEIFSCFAVCTLKKNHATVRFKSFKFIFVALTLNFWQIKSVVESDFVGHLTTAKENVAQGIRWPYR